MVTKLGLMRQLILTILGFLSIQMTYAQQPYISSHKKYFVEQFAQSDFTIKTKYSPNFINPNLKSTSNTTSNSQDSPYSMRIRTAYIIDYKLLLPAAPRYRDIILNPLFGEIIELETELPSVRKNYPVSRYRINLWNY